MASNNTHRVVVPINATTLMEVDDTEAQALMDRAVEAGDDPRGVVFYQARTPWRRIWSSSEGPTWQDFAKFCGNHGLGHRLHDAVASFLTRYGGPCFVFFPGEDEVDHFLEDVFLNTGKSTAKLMMPALLNGYHGAIVVTTTVEGDAYPGTWRDVVFHLSSHT